MSWDLWSPPGFNPKTSKDTDNYLTWVLHLFPGWICSHKTEACVKACIGFSGRAAVFSSIGDARKRKTNEYLRNPTAFVARLSKGITRAETEASEWGKLAAFRPNATSDVRWEETSLISDHPRTQFYDYSKVPHRYRRFLKRDGWPENYHLTFSRSEDNHDQARAFVRAGGTSAVVFKGKVPNSFQGLPVHPGYKHDRRFEDPPGHWIGLRFKGSSERRQRAITAGFAV